MVAITRQSLQQEIRRQSEIARSIERDQAAVSSGVKLSNPSDDAQAWIQISDIAKNQANNAAWTANIETGQARASQASTNLSQLTSLITRAQELMIQATSTPSTDKTAIVTELTSIRRSVSDLLDAKDYRGQPVYDDTTSIKMPVGAGLTQEATITRQAVSDDIDVNGTSMSLDDIFSAAIDAVNTGDSDARASALDGIEAASNRVIDATSLQGIITTRLDEAKERLSDADLTLTERRSKLEDTDLTETIPQLQAKLLQLQAAQAAFAKINGRTLFDLIS